MKLVGWDYPPLSSSRLKNMLTSFVFDLDPIITDNPPHELEEAVQITVDWMCEHGYLNMKQEREVSQHGR